MSDTSERKSEAFQIARDLNAHLELRSEFLDTLNTANHLLADLRNGKEPALELLTKLELGPGSNFALKMKLKGIISVKTNQLQIIKSSMMKDMKILERITVCPYCIGSGESLSQNYERFGRKIHTTVSATNCEHCQGTGKINLGSEVETIVSKTLEILPELSAR
jgi:hypothetical protein